MEDFDDDDDYDDDDDNDDDVALWFKALGNPCIHTIDKNLLPTSSEVSERGNGRASSSVLTSGFMIVLGQSASMTTSLTTTIAKMTMTGGKYAHRSRLVKP